MHNQPFTYISQLVIQLNGGILLPIGQPDVLPNAQHGPTVQCVSALNVPRHTTDYTDCIAELYVIKQYVETYMFLLTHSFKLPNEN